MNCVSCGRRAGYNRVVVDLVSGVEVGGLCVDCEAEEFGKVLERGYWDGEECGLCPRDGQFALPEWEAEATERDGDLHCSVSYSVTGGTPVLCDEHLHAIRPEEAPAAAADRARPAGRR